MNQTPVADKTVGVNEACSTSLISTVFDIFMLSVSSREQGTLIGGSIRIKNPGIHKAFLWLTTPKAIHSNIQMSTILSMRGYSSRLPTGYSSGSTLTWWQTSVKREAVRSLISLCRSPPFRYGSTWHTKKGDPHAQSEGALRGDHP